MQLVDVVRRQRTKAETHFRLRCDHVGLDPALDAADVEAQAGQPTEAAMRFALDEVERARAPAHGLVQGVGLHRRRARRMPGLRSEAHTSELPSLMRISYAGFCLKK